LKRNQKGKIQSRTIAKSSENWQNYSKKANKLTFTPGLNKWWDSSKLMTDCDDRWWKWWWFCVREHFFTKVDANPNPGKTDCSIASQNS
jgi:hypothetical protein